MIRWRRRVSVFLPARPGPGILPVLALVLALVPLVSGQLLITRSSSSPTSPPSSPAILSSTVSASLALTPDGQILLTVNPDSNSISMVDTASGTLIAEIPVGIDPRAVAISPDGAQAYVVNQGSDDLVAIDLISQAAFIRVPLGERPCGVAASPDGRFLAVAELGDDRVHFLETGTLHSLSRIAVPDRPHGLAFTRDSRRLLVSHLLSGTVSVVPVQPHVFHLPVIVASGSLSTSLPSTSSSLTADNRSGQTGLIPTWQNVAPAPAVVINASGTRAYLPQTMANGLGLNTQFDTTVFPKISVLDLERDQHLTSEHISLPETDRPVGLPWAAALARGDRELWVVNAGSDDVSVIDISDPTHPTRQAHIPVGANPRGVALSPAGEWAYIHNTLDGTVSVIDTQAYSVTKVITVTQIPLPPLLLHGKRLFHSSARPELARARWISCNTCHIEGEHDGRTWLLQFIGEVPIGARSVITRNTTSLLGMIETYPLRWSGEWDESADSEFSVRFEQYGTGLIHDGEMNPTLGPPNQGRSADLDALAAFIDSLPTPNLSFTLTPAGLRGKAIFESPATGCMTCHPAPLYTDLRVHDVGTADAYGEWFGPQIDTPSLRFLYDSAPYLHDGSAATLLDVLTAANSGDEHGVTSHLNASELDDLVNFLLALPYVDEEALVTSRPDSFLSTAP